jgi:hypothetical protein
MDSEQKISKSESLLLFLNATCYNFGKDIPKLIEPLNDNYYNNAYCFILIIEFAIMNLLTKSFNLNLNIELVAIGLCFAFHIMISFFYSKKIAIIATSYYNYYSGYWYALFILLLIASFGYLFNYLIGVDTGPSRYHIF